MLRFRASKTSLSPSSFPSDRSKAVPLLQFFFACASVVSFVAFVLPLFVLHLSFILFPVWAVLCDCGISWDLLLYFQLTYCYYIVR